MNVEAAFKERGEPVIRLGIDLIQVVDHSRQRHASFNAAPDLLRSYGRDVADYGERVSAALAAEFALLRQQRGWSLAQAAALADIHRSTIHLIERGDRGISVAVAARLAKAYETALSELLLRAERALRTDDER